MNRRSGRSRRNDSFVSSAREWVSDNLRYLLIAAAALIVILIVVFAVRASNNRKTADTGAEQAAAATASSASEWKKGPTSTITITPSAPTGTQQAETVAAGYPSLDVPGTVITYLDAVAYGDVDTAAAYSEELSEGTIAVVEAGHPFSEFNNIYVYEYPGAKSGEYVAVTTFDYTERATGNVFPGIGAYYLVTGSDGVIRMASDATTAANQAAIDEAVNQPEVQQIIADVNAAYAAAEAALSGSPAEGEPAPGEAAPEEGVGESEGAAEEEPPAEPEETGQAEGEQPAE